MYIEVHMPCIKIYFSEGESIKKADLSHFFLTHPGWLNFESAVLQFSSIFHFGGVRQDKNLATEITHCFSSLCSGLLNSSECELFTGAAPALLDLAGFPESAWLPAKLISQSILFLCCELLCWDLKCSELFLLDKCKYRNHEVLAGSRLCQLNTYLCLADKTVFNILVLLC